MPFKSKAQQRWMYAKHPEMAHEWAEHTPNMKTLPEKAKKKIYAKAANDACKIAAMNPLLKHTLMGAAAGGAAGVLTHDDRDPNSSLFDRAAGGVLGGAALGAAAHGAHSMWTGGTKPGASKPLAPLWGPAGSGELSPREQGIAGQQPGFAEPAPVAPSSERPFAPGAPATQPIPRMWGPASPVEPAQNRALTPMAPIGTGLANKMGSYEKTAISHIGNFLRASAGEASRQMINPALTGAAIGGVGGTILGGIHGAATHDKDSDSSRLGDALRGAGRGAVAGTAAGGLLGAAKSLPKSLVEGAQAQRAVNAMPTDVPPDVLKEFLASKNLPSNMTPMELRVHQEDVLHGPFGHGISPHLSNTVAGRAARQGGIGVAAGGALGSLGGGALGAAEGAYNGAKNDDGTDSWTITRALKGGARGGAEGALRGGVAGAASLGAMGATHGALTAPAFHYANTRY